MKNCILKHTDVNASIYPNLRLECGSVLLEDFTILEHDESSSMNANTLLFPLSDTWFHDSRLHALFISGKAISNHSYLLLRLFRGDNMHVYYCLARRPKVLQILAKRIVMVYISNCKDRSVPYFIR